MYLLIELISSLISRLEEPSQASTPATVTAGYHVSPDATLS